MSNTNQTAQVATMRFSDHDCDYPVPCEDGVPVSYNGNTEFFHCSEGWTEILGTNFVIHARTRLLAETYCTPEQAEALFAGNTDYMETLRVYRFEATGVIAAVWSLDFQLKI